MKGIIPEQNINNRKRGFVGLESQKINYNFDELKNNLFNKNKIKSQDIFNSNFLEIFINSFEKKGFYNEKGILNKNYSLKSLWALIMFQMWYDMFVENDSNFEFKLN